MGVSQPSFSCFLAKALRCFRQIASKYMCKRRGEGQRGTRQAYSVAWFIKQNLYKQQLHSHKRREDRLRLEMTVPRQNDVMKSLGEMCGLAIQGRRDARHGFNVGIADAGETRDCHDAKQGWMPRERICIRAVPSLSGISYPHIESVPCMLSLDRRITHLPPTFHCSTLGLS